MGKSLADLNEILFDQLDRLNNRELGEEELAAELNRAKAVSDVAGRVLESGKLTLDVCKFKDMAMDANMQIPKMLGGK